MSQTVQIIDLAKKVISHAKDKGIIIGTAESCTGGLISASLTEIPGSSAVFDRGFITYSNHAKIQMLGVSGDILENFGAVSAQTAQAMANGALAQSKTALCVSVTGIAGPQSDNSQKPIGLVYIATAYGDKIVVRENQFGDLGRAQIRHASTIKALEMLLEAIEKA